MLTRDQYELDYPREPDAWNMALSTAVPEIPTGGSFSSDWHYPGPFSPDEEF